MKKAASEVSSANNRISILKAVITLAVTAVLTVADLLLKNAAQAALSDGRVLKWGNFMALRYVENTGAAFSLFREHTSLLSVVTGIMLVLVLGFLFSGRVQSRLLYGALTLVTAGGLGNLIDRLRFGYVVDFIETLFVEFPVFNFADCLITVGAAGIILWLVLDSVASGKTKKKESAA